MLSEEKKDSSVFTRTGESKDGFTIFYNDKKYQHIKKNSYEGLYDDNFLNDFDNIREEFINDLGFEVYTQCYKYQYKSGDEINIKVKIL